jgi:hypothetical protein
MSSSLVMLLFVLFKNTTFFGGDEAKIKEIINGFVNILKFHVTNNLYFRYGLENRQDKK